MKVSKDDICYGCALTREGNDDFGVLCYTRKNHLHNKCPCVECVINFLCNDICEKYKNFNSKMWGGI